MKRVRKKYSRKLFPWINVDQKGADDCWPWKRSLNTWGYGYLMWKGKCVNASRGAWESINGDVPVGLVVCHKCDNPSCCNPAHLFVATQAENLKDCRDKGRQVYLSGADHHRPTAKITESDVREIRRLRAAGVLVKDIAEQYPIGAPAISRISRGIGWEHIK